MKTYNHLLDTLKPRHYELTLSPNREDKTFAGTVSISGILAKKTKNIELHQHGLKITNAKIDGVKVKHNSNDEKDSLVLKSSQQLNGEVVILLHFRGVITDSMNGMYPSSFEHKGKSKLLIGTQFESHHAREVFPCIDEPAAKATFQLTLDVPTDEAAISNTPIKKRLKQSGHDVITFEKTPIMSTYLLAFVYGELSSISKKSKHGVEVSVWSTPDNIDKTHFALDVGVASLEFFTDYFGIPFPLEKCDHIALPDFAAGAMENWGCITYRESQMLVDNKETSQMMKQLIAVTVAHEVAHQWFGNLVTMEWWTDLWLNEGFASWISVYAIDKQYPQWNLWEDFVADDVIRALSLDCLDNTHAVEVPIDQPEEIRSIFDAISYSKGASLLRMLHGYMGDADMKEGLRHYMNTYAYKNATTANLWQALEEATSKPVAKFMSAWTKQPGFPVISASYQGTDLSLEQTRFSISGKTFETVWPVPLYVDNLEILERSKQIKLDERPQKLNTHQKGLYFVAYDDSWRKSIDESFAELSVSDRVGYLYESYKLSQANLNSTTEVLKLIHTLKSEDNLYVWQNIASVIGSVRFIMDADAVDSATNKIVGDISKHIRAEVGYEEKDTDKEETLSLRATVLALSTRTGVAEVNDWANEQFDTLMNPDDGSANLRSVIMGAAVRNQHNNAYDRVLKWYKNTTSAQLKIQLMMALNATRDSEQIANNQELVTSEYVKLQEVAYWVSYMFSGRESRESAWKWIQENWDWLAKSFGRDIMTMSSFPLYVGRAFASKSRADEVEKFFSQVQTTGIDSKVAQALETIRYQATWRDEQRQKLIAEL